MAQIAPPQAPPLVSHDDGDGLKRVHLRIWQWWTSLLTILVTVWFMSLGPIPGIIAVVTAKHILVAIYVMGIGVDSRRGAR
jgi:hypothetical protein